MEPFRLRFTKEQNLKYLSHLELIKTMERAIRRGQIPLGYSEGFHPHPKLSFGPALAVGIDSLDEYFDLELTAEYDLVKLVTVLNQHLPKGLTIITAGKLKPNAKSLNAIINRAQYKMLIGVNQIDQKIVAERLLRMLESTTLEVSRVSKDTQKTVNIRPWLHTLTIETITENLITINLVGEIGSNGNLRPDDIIASLDLPVDLINVTRTGMWREENGTVIKPLDFCEKVGG